MKILNTIESLLKALLITLVLLLSCILYAIFVEEPTQAQVRMWTILLCVSYLAKMGIIVLILRKIL